MTTLKTISGFLIFVFFFAKVIVHYYLDRKHGRSGGFLYSLISPMAYFQGYKSDVDIRHHHLKRHCNGLFWLALISLLVNVALGAILYVNPNWRMP
ncbi:MAG: hypothetical protein JSS79_16035 [Bacteroidetes bacterium]|nr:hypothetical protein [Bacteroidota bacterium]